MPTNPYGAIAQGIGGVVSLFTGASQKRKGREMLKQIGDSPTESVPDEIVQNQKLATLRANTGLPSQQYNQAMKNIQRQQMMALNKANDRRGGLLTIAGNQQAANDALGKLDVADAVARINNEKTLMSVNNTLGGWKDKVWKNNVLDKWNRKYQYAQSLVGSGNMNFTGGLDRIAGAGATYLGSSDEESKDGYATGRVSQDDFSGGGTGRRVKWGTYNQTHGFDPRATGFDDATLRRLGYI